VQTIARYKFAGLWGLVMDAQELLGRSVDVVSERTLHPAMRDQVLREALPL